MPRVQLVWPHAQRRRDRLSRTVRAVWRDSMALWHEFRAPFVIFLAASFGGGYLYGLLNTLAGNEPIPPGNLPYTMVALMVLQTPIPMPSQPYLIAFWYLLPALGIYIAGRGATDFMRLFFDRSGRRAEWEEAVASTYRNHVIVLGVGHVGLRVIRWLIRLGFDVVALNDTLSPELETELSRLGVPCIVADARSQPALEKAGIQHAQSIVICTSDDYTNLQVALRVRNLRKDIRIVMRTWESEFTEQIGVLPVSASDLAAPAFAGAAVGIEITHSLSVHDVDYSTIRLEVEPGSLLDGKTIGTLQESEGVDVVLHGRDGSVDVHPDRKIVVRAGDTLVIFAAYSKVTELVTRNHRPQREDPRPR